MTLTPVITQPIAGPFTATMAPITFSAGVGTVGSATTLGIIGSRGVRELRRYQAEQVGADLLGGATVDNIHLCAELFLEFELEEFNRLGVMQLSHPFQETTVSDLASILSKEGETGIPGMYHSVKSCQLVLTASSSSHSAGAQATPTRTYGLVSIAPNFELAKLLASRRRVCPLRLQCLPYLDSANSATKYVYFTKS